MDDDNKITSCIGIVVSFVLLLVVSTVVDGWALSRIWNWFIPPIFNLPSLTLMQAVGVAMVLQLFTRNNTTRKEDSKAETVVGAFVEAFVKAAIVPVLTVGLGWIVLQFAF